MNETGAFLDFSVAPAYYQTIWFRSTVAVAFLALGVGLYQLRLRQVARQFNVRFEERVNERTRIARDLHDTLLQSFQAVLLKFHALTYTIPPEAQKTLQSVLDEAAQAIDEGRDAVQGLRASAGASHDLVSIIRALGDELAGGRTGADAPDFRMHVEGAPRDLAPLVQDDVYRIAGEALRNAFRHAHARQIEADVRYDPRQFRVRVRDDGKGIDQQVLDGAGRTGHYGLPGMRERATLVRGHLTVWSERDSGTEIELTIPSSVAYAKSPAVRPSAIENSDSMPL